MENNGLAIWEKPQASWVKCNTDGAVFSTAQKLGYGWVVQDEKGQMIVASGRSFARPLDGALAEAISVREALSWLKSSPFGQIIVEIDSMQVSQTISDSQSAPNYFGYAIDDCKHLLQTMPQCRVIFVRRSANSFSLCLLSSC